jgi:hypothetical protein
VDHGSAKPHRPSGDLGNATKSNARTPQLSAEQQRAVYSEVLKGRFGNLERFKDPFAGGINSTIFRHYENQARHGRTYTERQHKSSYEHDG